MSDRELIDRFMSRAAVQAERAIAGTRVAIIVLVGARLWAIAYDGLLAGEGKHWFAMGSLVAALILSVVVWRGVERADDKRPWLVASTMLDALATFCVVLPSVWTPRPDFFGILRVPDFGIWPLVIAASGLRLSSLAAWAGALTATAGVATLLALDLRFNADRLNWGFADVIMAVVLLIGAATFALRMAAWIRRLVGAAAKEAASAEARRQRLGAYVSEEVAALVDAGPIALGGTERHVAVLFSDLRGFTAYSSSADADALIRELNAYFEAMVTQVRAHGGVVDKYIGDAIMVVFGIPDRRGDEASRAIATALAMRRALHDHNARRAEAGLPPLRQGIGVHYGRAVAGNVGVLERVQYTVVGDTVNVASRLEGETKALGVDILLSGAVVARAREEGATVDVVPLDPIALRGHPGKHEVYTVASAT